MGTDKTLFTKAFLEAEALDNSTIKPEEEIEWIFSDKFEKSMEKLLQNNTQGGNTMFLLGNRHISNPSQEKAHTVKGGHQKSAANKPKRKDTVIK